MTRIRESIAAGVIAGLSSLAAAAPLTADPLTGLPLPPTTKPPFGDNTPTAMPDSQICKSQTQANFYSVFNTRVSATLNWYATRLPGFQRAHAFVNGRSQDAFFSADGTTVVSVTGEPGKEGEDAQTYAVSYTRFRPGLPAKAIAGILQQKIACN